MPQLMSTCEDMAKIICGASKLKSDIFKTRLNTAGSALSVI